MLTKCTEVDDYVAKLHTYDFSWNDPPINPLLTSFKNGCV